MVREESACFRSVNQKQFPARTGGSIDYLLLNLPGESLFFIENAKLGKAEKEEDHHHHLNHRHYSATPPLGNEDSMTNFPMDHGQSPRFACSESLEYTRISFVFATIILGNLERNLLFHDRANSSSHRPASSN